MYTWPPAGWCSSFQASDSVVVNSCSASNSFPKLPVIKSYTVFVSTWDHFFYNKKERKFIENAEEPGELYCNVEILQSQRGQ